MSKKKPKAKIKKHKPYWRESRGGVEVPNFIAEWRQFRHFETQVQLAKASGIPSQTISRLESGRMAYTFLTLQKLAKVLDCTEGDLVSHPPNGSGQVTLHWVLLSSEARKKLLDHMKGLMTFGKKDD